MTAINPVMAKMGAGEKGYAFIAAQNFANPEALPASSMHVFYGTRALTSTICYPNTQLVEQSVGVLKTTEIGGLSAMAPLLVSPLLDPVATRAP